MSEMVERVARAICEAEGIDPDRDSFPSNGHRGPCWELFENQARAAIAAMRDIIQPMGEWVDGNDICNRIDASLEPAGAEAPAE